MRQRDDARRQLRLEVMDAESQVVQLSAELLDSRQLLEQLREQVQQLVAAEDGGRHAQQQLAEVGWGREGPSFRDLKPHLIHQSSLL